jgi:hypothetical protein
MKIKVGCYDLGTRDVDVYLTPKESGGTFTGGTRETRRAEITVGVMDWNWEATVCFLLHETFELAFMDVQARLQPSPNYTGGSDSFVFFASHAQFSDACARAAMLLAECLPHLSTVFTEEKAKSELPCGKMLPCSMI